MDTRRAANQGENVGGEMDVDETLHTGSFQTPLTSERSADYYAGQHPINVATCVLNVTGCQHAVTHPEVSTGQSSGMTQPSWQQSLDQDGTELWTDAGVGGSSHSAYVAPHYSGVGGPEYSPAFTRVTNDAGQVS